MGASPGGSEKTRPRVTHQGAAGGRILSRSSEAMDIDRAEFVIVDTETTGSRAGDDRLIEIGAARLVGGEIVDTFQQLIDPGRHVPNRITRLTGISTAMVYGQPSATEEMPRFLEFLGDAVLDFSPSPPLSFPGLMKTWVIGEIGENPYLRTATPPGT